MCHTALREVILQWFHAFLAGGRRGAKATLGRMRRLVRWKGSNQDVKKYVAACPCRRLLSMTNRYFMTIRGVLECPRPHELLSIDFIGPNDWKGRKWHIVCIVDHVTRYMGNMVDRDTTADKAVSALKNYRAIFGATQVHLSDNGAAFTSEEFKNYVLSVLRARHVRSSPYYPQENAINESNH